MAKCAVFVIGPAGAGKSTFSSDLTTHARLQKKPAHLLNLDPAAEAFKTVQPSKDIRELVQLDMIAEEFKLGPNGALINSLEYLLENEDWITDDLDQYDSDYLVVDCPGQIEVYTHYDILQRIIKLFEGNGYRTCCIYLLESHFVSSNEKFFAGVLNSMSAMMRLETPHINIMSKCDLVQEMNPSLLENYLKVDLGELIDFNDEKTTPLTKALVTLIEEYGIVDFIPYKMNDNEAMQSIMTHIDLIVQWDETEEVRTD